MVQNHAQTILRGNLICIYSKLTNPCSGLVRVLWATRRHLTTSFKLQPVIHPILPCEISLGDQHLLEALNISNKSFAERSQGDMTLLRHRCLRAWPDKAQCMWSSPDFVVEYSACPLHHDISNLCSFFKAGSDGFAEQLKAGATECTHVTYKSCADHACTKRIEDRQNVS